MRLTIEYLYPDLMNMYGDRGNVITLSSRCRWHGIAVTVRETGVGDHIAAEDCDLLFIGGGQDKEQLRVSEDMQGSKAETIRSLVDDGASALAVCGGFQLFGHHFKTGSGSVLRGIGLFDAWTIAGEKRCIGDVVVECRIDGQSRTLVGFENHSGKTYLGPTCAPLGRVLCGAGNNDEDGLEGAIYKGAVGTYLHGSLLPKNPWLADWLILAALRRRYGPNIQLPALDDSLETAAHDAVIARIKRRGRLHSGAT